MRGKVIDFILVAFKEYFIEGGHKKNKVNYYGHNFNNTFGELDIDIRDGIYMALVLFLEFGEYDNDNLFRYNLLCEWLKLLKVRDINPSGTMTDNWNLKWNLFYQLKRLNH